ncbi:MAG: type II toxin-antitoxin system HipA family toxin, partial [Alphaproteobacteria bacterium]
MNEQYTPVELIHVSLIFDQDRIPVGRLALQNRKIYFEYDKGFLERNLKISPYKFPVKPGVQSFDLTFFDGLPGVFHDSLPDGWGRLILDRALRAKNISPESLTALDRLAHVGRFGMGALVYEPDYKGTTERKDTLNLDTLATQAQKILEGATETILEDLVALNGSSAGARPKAMVGVNADRSQIIYGIHDLTDDFEHWLIKFPNMADDPDCGAIEFVYAQMAKEAGVDMTETHLFPSKKSPGYFGTKRFDRQKNKRLHLHTAAGLLHSNFRQPALDYTDLIKLTLFMTRDVTEAEKMFRIAVFNVLSHNRDDHGKNFSFLMNEKGHWALSPAYDLIYSAGPGSEQSTLVAGEGRNPGQSHLLDLAKSASLPAKKTKE